MDRLTAGLLLVLLLVGTFAPVALALSAPPPHACCLRRPMHDHGSSRPELQAVGGEHRNCCPPATTANWARLSGGVNSSVRPVLACMPPASRPVLRSSNADGLYPVRAPPQFSIL